MAKKKKFRKKELRKHLTGMMMIHLDAHSLPINKNKKLQAYLGKKMFSIVDYYVRLLTKKRAKKIIKQLNTEPKDKAAE